MTMIRYTPKEELTVEVTDVDRVHVYYMNILETRECEIRQDLASQTTRANDKNFALIPQEVFNLHVINTRHGMHAFAERAHVPPRQVRSSLDLS